MTAYNVVSPGALVAGQPEDVSILLSNLNAIAAVINGAIDDTNFAAGKIFDNTKIKQGGSVTDQALVWNGASWVPAYYKPSKLAQDGATVGQVLTWNASVWAPATPPPAQYYQIAGEGAAAAVSVANTAYLSLLPSIAGAPFSVTKIIMSVATQSGNMDLGLYYTDDEATFTRVFSTAGFAVPAVGKQTKTFGAQTITPLAGRRWFLGYAADNAVASFFQCDQRAAPFYTKVTSYPLPASLTGMTAATGTSPMLMLGV